MVQTAPNRSGGGQPLGFHRHVTDAISDWEGLFKSRVREWEAACHTAEEVGIRPGPYPGEDQARSVILRELIDDYLVSFNEWCAEEVLVFLLIACPRENLMNTTARGEPSMFLTAVYQQWRPSFLDWAHVLWEFAGRACELFSDVLFVMPPDQKPTKSIIGKVLFKDLVEKGIVRKQACASFIGVLLPYPFESTYARKHEEEMEFYAQLLSPEERGLMCRSLMLYRSRSQKHCKCGYRRGEDGCTCAARVPAGGGRDRFRIPLSGDLDKEYALVIFKLILERHCKRVLNDDLQWTKDQRDELVRSGCDVVFSEAIYTEIYQNLHEGRKPVLKQRQPRSLTEKEKNSNVTRNFDNDYNHSMAQHGGCVSHSCKQAMKVDCANVSCKRHCRSAGLLSCRAHRMYNTNPLPTGPPRKRIQKADERQKSGPRYNEVREGDI